MATSILVFLMGVVILLVGFAFLLTPIVRCVETMKFPTFPQAVSIAAGFVFSFFSVIPIYVGFLGIIRLY